MEKMFIWTLVVSGALVALLGVFLAAAERELKNKKAEVEQLLSKLESQIADPASVSALSADQEGDQEPSGAAELNQKLKDEITRLSKELEQSRKNNERLEAARLEDTNAADDAERLSEANQQLKADVADLREKLRISEARSTAPAERDVVASESNAELQSQVAELQKQLEVSAAKIEELKTAEQKAASGKSLEAFHADQEKLSEANQQLKADVAELREELRVSEARSNAPAERDATAAERNAVLEGQVEELQNKLAASAAKIEELKIAEQKAASVKSLEAFHADEEKRFETKIAELEKELTAERAKVTESDSLRERLARSERETQSLHIERRQQDEEISLWQTRAGEAEAPQRRLASLQAHYDSVLSEHAALAENQNRFQDQLATFARLLNARVDSAESSTVPVAAKVNGTAAPRSIPEEDYSAETEPVATIAVAPAAIDGKPVDSPSTISAPERLATAVEVVKKRNHRFGISPLMIGITVLSTIAFATWYKSSQQVEVPIVTASAIPAPKVEQRADPAPAVAVEQAAPDPEPTDAPPVQVTAKPRESVRAVAKESAEIAKPVSAAKLETRVAGIYEITRPSHVYAAPSELSPSIGDIEPGVKVNVVNSRDGWLEIHSKYDRPPGYVRKEFAARVSGQN